MHKLRTQEGLKIYKGGVLGEEDEDSMKQAIEIEVVIPGHDTTQSIFVPHI